jgi:hypothetical protein
MILILSQEDDADIPPTCLPPVFILKNGDSRVPIWPNPPSTSKASLPTFCPKEYRQTILQKFRVHFHQHPVIPMGDEEGTLLSAEEIHHGAVRDMYEFCFTHDLAQVWVYMWNRWYTPKQWCLWARAACDAIARLKTTMIVESLWKHIKHRELAQFNSPRLDLVTHLVITNLLPRVMRTLAYIRGLWRIGRPTAPAAWQVDIKSMWLDMSRKDELRLMEKQLKCLKSARNTKGRAERLELLEAAETQEHRTWLTDVEQWTCNCPSFAPNRFLICKHLVREVNKRLHNLPLNSLQFFIDLRRYHYPPFYHIPGIHDTDNSNERGSGDEEEEVQILALGRAFTRSSSESCTSETSKDIDVDEEPDRVGGNSSEHSSNDESAGPSNAVGTDDEMGSETENGPCRVNSNVFCAHYALKPLAKVKFPPARITHLKCCFDDLMEIMDNPKGVQPKMAARLEHLFAPIETAANDIHAHKRRRTRARTWKDSTPNTMFLD